MSAAEGVSSDGFVVVGGSSAAAGVGDAFRWTDSSGMVSLGTLQTLNPPISDRAESVSADGSIIVGGALESTFADGAQQDVRKAFRWENSTGMVSLGTLPSYEGSDAKGISADGSVIVGLVFHVGAPSNEEAFRWENNAMSGLGQLPGGSNSRANAASSDGSVVVGGASSSSTTGEALEAFRWTSDNGMVGLGTLPGSSRFQSEALGVSSDGRVVVGFSWINADSFEAFRWTAETGMNDLADFPGGDFASQAKAVSDDGIIVGHGNSPAGPEAAIWTAGDAGSLRRLQDVIMNDYGLAAELTGWKLTSAECISPNGLYIAGRGVNPNGDQEAWLFVVPEPSTLALAMLGLLCILGNARRRGRPRV